MTHPQFTPAEIAVVDAAIDAIVPIVCGLPERCQASVVASLVGAWLTSTRRDPAADWAEMQAAIDAGLWAGVGRAEAGGRA